MRAVAPAPPHPPMQQPQETTHHSRPSSLCAANTGTPGCTTDVDAALGSGVGTTSGSPRVGAAAKATGYTTAATLYVVGPKPVTILIYIYSYL